MNAIGRILRMTLAVGLVLLVPTPAYAEETPPPEGEVAVVAVTSNGNGCRPQSVEVIGERDNTFFRIRYHGFRAFVGDDAKPTDFRKNCQVNLQIHPPTGYTYAIKRVEQSGRARLTENFKATQRFSFYSAGQVPISLPTFELRGPYDDYWTRIDDLAEDQRIYAPCGQSRNLNVNIEARIFATGQRPYPTNSITQGLPTPSEQNRDGVPDSDAKYYYAWKACPPS
jgi:hypothetical protein